MNTPNEQLLKVLLGLDPEKSSIYDFIINCQKVNNSFPVKDTEDFLNQFIRKYSEDLILSKGANLYRARIHDEPNNYYSTRSLDISYAKPPSDQVSLGGRFNRPGFSYLYLSDNEETAVYEVKPSVFTQITVFKGVLKTDVKLADFSKVVSAESFALIKNSLTPEEKNELMLKNFVRYLISLPVTARIEHILYSPTRLISDYIKSQGYDGISFCSSIKVNGINYVLFDKSSVDFQEKGIVFSVDGLTYQLNKQKPLDRF